MPRVQCNTTEQDHALLPKIYNKKVRMLATCGKRQPPLYLGHDHSSTVHHCTPNHDPRPRRTVCIRTRRICVCTVSASASSSGSGARLVWKLCFQNTTMPQELCPQQSACERLDLPVNSSETFCISPPLGPKGNEPNSPPRRHSPNKTWGVEQSLGSA